jgi:hypothetical protein
MYCEKINSFERDYLKLHAVVVSVHSHFDTAWMAKQSYWERNQMRCDIKESSSGYGFVVYSFSPRAKKLVKYDLSHMF